MKKFLTFIFAFTVLLHAAAARAELKVDITRGVADPIPIAITDFYAKNPAQNQAGKEVADVIRNNLKRSGLFEPIDQAAYIQSPAALQLQPRFADWRAINAQALVSGTVELQSDGRLRVEFRLWDVFAEQQMVGLAYFTPPNNWRRISHIVSDAIYKRITGEEGYFDTRIVYVSESGIANKRIKRLAIMDQDGANHRFLTDGRSLVLTPRFSPSTQEITYLAFYRNRPRVYLLNIDTGREEVLGDFPGMTFAPRFSTDGRKVLMSLSDDGNTDIHSMDLNTRQTRRLTDHPSIDTSPSYSPDGKQVVFNSDRGGSQQLYTMNADGSDVKRISFGRGKYATPVWSPRGDLIAFTKFLEGSFYIGVMRADGSGERLLSESYLEEGPTWAPNGRVLMFYRQGRMDSNGSTQAKLYSVDLTGKNLQLIPTPMDASDPAWSPLIP